MSERAPDLSPATLARLAELAEKLREDTIADAEVGPRATSRRRSPAANYENPSCYRIVLPSSRVDNTQ